MKKQTNIPQLRFPNFKGEWEKKTLGKMIIQMQSGVSRKLSDVDIGLPILRSNNIQDGILNVKEIKYWHLIDDKGANLENYLLKENDILVNFINSLAQIGKAALYKNLLRRDTIFTTNILRLSLKDNVDTNFVFYNFNTKNYLEYIKSITKPAVNQASFTTKEFQNYIINLPTLHEQSRIASFFTVLDKKIAELKQKKNLLEQYKKGVMQKIFSQELRFKDDNGKDFPKWENNILGDTGEIVSGGTPDTSNQIFWNGDIEWFTPTEIKSKYTSSSLRKISKSGLQQSSANLLPIGTILFSSRATIGDVSIALKECTTNQGFKSFIVNKEFNNEFLYYWINQNRNEFLKRASGSTFLEISKGEIEKIRIYHPCLKEQTKIATFLSVIDKKINHTETQLEKTELYKKGLLQKMFV